MFHLGVYRCRLDIIADILDVVSGDAAKKTQIMYKANLSYAILQKYLTELSAASLISYVRERAGYVITGRGREFLQVYKDYSKTNRHVKKRLHEAGAKKKVLERLCSGTYSSSNA